MLTIADWPGCGDNRETYSSPDGVWHVVFSRRRVDDAPLLIVAVGKPGDVKVNDLPLPMLTGIRRTLVESYALDMLAKLRAVGSCTMIDVMGLTEIVRRELRLESAERGRPDDKHEDPDAPLNPEGPDHC